MSERPKTLGELIEVPPIRVVIQLADLADHGLQGEILESFVFTDEVEVFFQRLLGALDQPKGLGCFLKGHYGSGKSHALAFLCRLLEGDPRALKQLPPDLPTGALDRPWLVCQVPLLAFPSSSSLEQIVLEQLEARVRGAGLDLILSGRSRLLGHFRELILPRHGQAPELQGFADLSENQAYERAIDFLGTLPDNPLRLSFDRREVFERLGSLLEHQGMVLLLDELSEFLKSKPDERAFNEDIRFLQFLGEWSDKLPLWIVASLQENLEELGFREQAGYQRIKERYPLRFTLSARHVVDLIQGRLIRLKPGAEDEVDRLWQELERAFPGLVTRADFRRFYPLHPSTLELLESLMPLFSRHRGVVDFVHSQLAGDPHRGLKGLLEEAPERLLTAEAIYDHFRDRIRETPEIGAYDRVAFTYLEKEIPRLFESQADQQLALRLVKVLILLELSPAEITADPGSLARLTVQKVSRLNPAVNTRHVEANILQPLLAKSSYLSCREGCYHIDLEADSRQLLRKRLRELARTFRLDWNQALLLANRQDLPLSELVRNITSSETVKWQNTPRTVRLQFGLELDYPQLMELLEGLERGKEDLLVLMAAPGQGQLLAPVMQHFSSSAMGAACLCWKPKDPSPELQEQLAEAQARRLLLGELEAEGSAETLPFRQQQREIETGLGEQVAELYLQGQIHSLKGQDPVPETSLGWKPRLLHLAAPVWEQLFPKHLKVAPASDCLTVRNLNALWSEFIEAGSCSGQGPLLVRELILPLGLALATEEGFRLDPDPARAPVLGQILDRLLPGQKLPLAELACQLAKGPYGLNRTIFAVLVACLVQAGRATVYANDRATPLDSLESLLRFRFQTIGPTKQLEASVGKRLSAMEWLWPAEEVLPFTPARQTKLWEQARGELEDLTHRSARVKEMVLQAQRLDSGKLLPLEELKRCALAVEELCLQVGLLKGTAAGLKRLSSSHAATLSREVAWVRGWSEFGLGHLREFQQLAQKLEEPDNLEALSEVEQSWPLDLEVADPLPRWLPFATAFAEVEAERRQAYLEFHKEYYSDPVFQQVRRLEALPQWQALLRLERVVGVEFEPRVSSLRQRLESLPRPCRRRVEEHLVLASRCPCGLSWHREPPNEEDLEPEIEQALQSGLESLAERRTSLEAHLRDLRQLGKHGRVETLEELLSVLTEVATEGSRGPGFWPRNSGRLLGCLDGPTLEAVNRALTGEGLIVSRDLPELLERFQGVTLPPARLRMLFEDWLAVRDLPADAWIEVRSREPGRERLLQVWLAQHQLRPTQAMLAHYALDEGDTWALEEPLFPAFSAQEVAAAEAEFRPLLEPLLPGLPLPQALVRERLFPGVAQELGRRALRLLMGGPASSSAPFEPHSELHSQRHRELAQSLIGLDLPYPFVPVLAAAAEACLCWRTEESLAELALQVSRALYLDREQQFLTPDLEESLRAIAAEGWARLPLPKRTLAQAPSLLAPLLKPQRPLIILLIDALRWDLYLQWRPWLVRQLGEPVLEEQVLAELPTVTVRARNLLLGGEEFAPQGSDGLFLERPVVMVKCAEDHPQRVAEVIAQGSQAVWLHLNFVDHRIHQSRLELSPLFRELTEEAPARLAPILRALPPKCTILLAADHGFLGAEERSHHRPHGGPSPQERLVPWVAWQRG